MTLSPSPPRILIISDPGLPTRRLERCRDSLEAAIRESLGEEATVDHLRRIVPVTPENEIASEIELPEESRDVRYDARVFLTEMPLHREKQPVVAQMDRNRNHLFVSCPTMGVLYPKKRLVDVISRGVSALVTGWSEENGATQGWNQWRKQEHSGEDGIYRLFAHTVTGPARAITGMVMANEPWKTIPKLSSAMSAAAAAGAFGIFYSSIWQMAATLSPVRLAVITVVSILVMTTWLILRNRLWDRPLNERLGRVVVLYNISTIVTLIICIAALYASLFVLILLGGLVIISPEFMQQTLGSEPKLSDYLVIAWLSASMGVIAGGLGSGFDAEADLRRMTHGQRERQRVLTRDDDESRDEDSSRRSSG